MQPNILLFVTDDHGAWAMPFNETAGIEAPNLRFLSDTGIVFPNAYCASPVCSPARASLYTGTIPSYHGVHDYLEDVALGADHPGILALPNLGTLAQKEGYTTGLFGKWHCSNFLAPHPGFDRWFTLRDGTNARFGEQRFVDQNKTVEHFGHQSLFITEAAREFVRSSGENPWLAVVNYTGTHTPHDNAPERALHNVRKRRVGTRIGPEGTADFPHRVRFGWPDGTDEQNDLLDDYRASVEAIDDEIGALLDAVDSSKTDRNTIVIYTSDHGHMNGHYGLHTKGNATIPQNLLEPSLHVPLVIRDTSLAPGVATPSVGHTDLFTTIVSYVREESETEINDDVPRPGRSLRPLLANLSATAEFMLPRFAEYGNARSIWTDRWKLVTRYQGPNGHFSDELYRVEAGIPVESAQVSEEPLPSQVSRDLQERLDAYFDAYSCERSDGRYPERFRPHNSWEPWKTDPTQFPAGRE